MLSRLSRRVSYANVVATMALFVALGGTAYAVNTVNSTDIVDGQVKSVDVGDGEVKSADVKDQSLTTFDVSTFIGADIVDGSLTAKDVGENEFNFAANIPKMFPTSCITLPITGAAAQGDHMLLTADNDDSDAQLTYSIEYEPSSQNAELKVCNPTNITIDNPHITHFNLLVFQH